MLEKVGQYTHLPGQGIGIVITATGVTPEIVRVDFLIVGSCFFIANISVTKSGVTHKQTEGLILFRKYLGLYQKLNVLFISLAVSFLYRKENEH